MAIDVPRDWEASFEPELIPKRKRDVSDIEGKFLSMYARGMSQRDIAVTIEDIYGFDSSNEMISDITDSVLSEMEGGAKAIFFAVIVQRCIVHLVRNTLSYIPSKDYKEVCRDMKKFYGASSLNAAQRYLRQFTKSMVTVSWCRRHVEAKLLACRTII